MDSDISFSLLVADSSAASFDKEFDHMSNQWQVPAPAWHPHHRQVPPPANSLPAPYAMLGSPRHARAATASVPINDHHDHHRHEQLAPPYDVYPSEDAFRGYAYAHESDHHDENDHANYYNSSQWQYQSAAQQQQSTYSKPSSEISLGIDPLPLPHVVVPHHVPSAVEEDLYDARMLQEALTTPHYPRHHPVYQSHQPIHQSHQPHYTSSPFVSAMLEASTHSNGMPTSMYQMRTTPSSTMLTTSPISNPSDSEAASDRTSGATGKRKRRGEAAPRLCRVEGCTKGIRSRGLCKAHGGGRRCMTPGCTTSDQGGGHCVLHGGGRRCSVGECTKSAQWKGLCKMHGGARRCRYENCTKNGQVKQGYCRAHHNLITKQREQAKNAAT